MRLGQAVMYLLGSVNVQMRIIPSNITPAVKSAHTPALLALIGLALVSVYTNPPKYTQLIDGFATVTKQAERLLVSLSSLRPSEHEQLLSHAIENPTSIKENLQATLPSCNSDSSGCEHNQLKLAALREGKKDGMIQFQHTTAKIAAWNLAGFGRISDERVERQVEGLALLDAEVVALVEINSLSVLKQLKEGLGKKGVVYKSVILEQANALHIGVLFKDGVVAENPRLLAGSDLNDPERRKAFLVDMKVGAFDFLLIVVHLKSGRNSEEQKIRDEQAKVIGSFITNRRRDGREDILLVGDFNMIPGQDVSNFHHLGGDDLMNFLSSWDLQDRYSHILKVGRANLLDGFAISRTFSTEYIRGSLRVFPMHWAMNMGREKFRKDVSDHLPLVASFRIDRDRD